MSRIKLNLSPELLIRQEGSIVYLFNRWNNAAIKVSGKLYSRLAEGILDDDDNGRKILGLLDSNGMLKNDEAVKSNKSDSTPAPGSFSTMFQLQSDKNPFNVLWAIISKCNLRCIYCFPDVKSIAPTFLSLPWDDLNKITEQLIAAKVFQVTLSGGEAFLEKNMWKIVDKLYKNNIKVLVITNGTTITDEIIQKLKKYRLFVGVSIDAPNEEINAITRGKDNFKRTVNGIKKLIEAGIQTIALVTLNRYNFPVLEEHVKFIYEELKIKHITLQDLRLFSTKDDYDAARLNCAQEQKLRTVVDRIKQNFPDIYFNLTELFLLPNCCSTQKKNGKLMQCPAGYNVAYIDFYGDMYPCTNLLTMKLGNLLADGAVTQLWQNSEAMINLRKLKSKTLDDLPDCYGCKLTEYCDGGCRGDALFYSNDLYGLPSRCPKLMFGDDYCQENK